MRWSPSTAAPRDGAGAVIGAEHHVVALETAMLGTFSDGRPCKHKTRRPPTGAAQAEAARLRGLPDTDPAARVVIDMNTYSETFGDANRRAIHRFTFHHGNHADRQANTTFWLEHELRQYPRAVVDLDALIAGRGPLVAAVGQGELRPPLSPGRPDARRSAATAADRAPGRAPRLRDAPRRVHGRASLCGRAITVYRIGPEEAAMHEDADDLYLWLEEPDSPPAARWVADRNTETLASFADDGSLGEGRDPRAAR